MGTIEIRKSKDNHHCISIMIAGEERASHRNI